MNEFTERQAIRRALLDAAALDLQDADGLDVPPFSPAYQRWERKLLRDPDRLVRQSRRPRWQKVLRSAACLLLAAVLTFGTVMVVSPSARATVAEHLGIVKEVRLPGVEVTVQLGGVGGCVYTSEKFACVRENGNVLRYGFKNTGEEPCTMQLYKVGLFGDKCVGEAIPIDVGDDAYGTYQDPGNDTFYIRITSVMGGNVSGSMKASQMKMSYAPPPTP